MTDGFCVTGFLPRTPDRLDPGTNVAIVGPSMSGKRALAFRLLTANYEPDDGILCISTDNAESVFDDLERYAGSIDRNRVGVIDCSGRSFDLVSDGLTETISSPADLTGISIGSAKLMKQLSSRGISDIRYGLISVSTLLQYLDRNTVFKFLHVFTNRVAETDGLGIYTLNDDTHEPTTVNTIKGQFDAVIELRETETGDYEYRALGLGRESMGWEPIESSLVDR
ncbi:RAD55 family ATPase [Halovivax gelatinilyticus]|uniref:RAD55 family ATPase n=1 Tax=Halovivax gelatinilyticus TaxID=2961597 RepID=UPI0020CA8AA2|nr:hypothetical protein [Halovivax gelatinilyticus]